MIYVFHNLGDVAKLEIKPDKKVFFQFKFLTGNKYLPLEEIPQVARRRRLSPVAINRYESHVNTTYDLIKKHTGEALDRYIVLEFAKLGYKYVGKKES